MLLGLHKWSCLLWGSWLGLREALGDHWGWGNRQSPVHVFKAAVGNLDVLIQGSPETER